MAKTITYRSFCLGCGMHEDAYIAKMLLHNSQGFDSPLTGIIHIANILREYLVMEYESSHRLKPCTHCKAAQEAKVNFCSDCGLKTSVSIHMEPSSIEEVNEDLMELWQNVYGSTNDGFPHDLWELFDTNGWSIYASPGGNNWTTVSEFEVLLRNGITKENVANAID